MPFSWMYNQFGRHTSFVSDVLSKLPWNHGWSNTSGP
jgi:hypothetical protein